MKILQILVLMLGLFVAGYAQNVSEISDKTKLSGTVFDPNGAVIPQTKVTFTNKAGETFSTTTNSEGVYKIELNEGSYALEFYRAAFERIKIENYNLAFRSVMRLDVSLNVIIFVDPIPVPVKKKKKT